MPCRIPPLQLSVLLELLALLRGVLHRAPRGHGGFHFPVRCGQCGPCVHPYFGADWCCLRRHGWRSAVLHRQIGECGVGWAQHRMADSLQRSRVLACECSQDTCQRLAPSPHYHTPPTHRRAQVKDIKWLLFSFAAVLFFIAAGSSELGAESLMYAGFFGPYVLPQTAYQAPGVAAVTSTLYGVEGRPPAPAAGAAAAVGAWECQVRCHSSFGSSYISWLAPPPQNSCLLPSPWPCPCPHP